MAKDYICTSIELYIDMLKQLLCWSTLLILLPSCSGNSPHISVACEENPRMGLGNCIIKWETQPVIEGKVKIYASTNPDSIPEINPILTTDIATQFATIVINDPTQRYYFKMVFDNRWRVTTASHNAVIPGVQNFRDIGGYSTRKGKKTTRWGKVYRSGRVERLYPATVKELKNIGVKTIIDFRTPKETLKTPNMEKEGFKVVRLPIAVVDLDVVLMGLRRGIISNDSVRTLINNATCEIIECHKMEFREMFDVLLDEANYPVVISCTTGLGRTSLASLMLFSVLGVDEDVIVQDYMRNNDFLDLTRIVSFGYQLPSRGQEALTTLFSAREQTLEIAERCIINEYGNMNSYLTKEIELTSGEMKKIREMLLY